MKNRKLALLLIVLTTSTMCFAQSTRWGIQGGATYSNLTYAADGEVESDDYKPGFTAGVMMDHQLGKKIFLQSALNYVQKGAEFDDEYRSGSLRLSYLEIPLNLVFRTKKEYGFMIGGGPSLGIGLGGTSKFEDQKIDVEFGGEDNPNRFQLEANFLAGYIFPSKVQLSLSYNFGITNMTGEGDMYRVKNNYFGLRVGYFFK